MNENTFNSVFRIIDASYNRAMEGLRVVEDFARMHLNDQHFSHTAKQLRHRLATLINNLSDRDLVHFRDILHDVGTENQTATEYKRADFSEIVKANFARVLQSLRTVEEYSKMIASSAGADFESLRYQVYGLEKSLISVLIGQATFPRGQLYVLTDSCGNTQKLHLLIKQLIEAKVDFIQLRDKTLNDNELVAVGKQLTQWTRNTETRWIMNDRSDLAVATGADGVHLGQDDLDAPTARRIVGSEMIIGISTHQFEQATDAVANGANYIGVGPVNNSSTKSFESFASETFIRQVYHELSIPAFAIGGIDRENIDDLLRIGVDRVAVSGAIINADHPGQAAAELKRRLTANLAQQDV